MAALLLLLVLVLLTTSVPKQREVPATVSSFYVPVVYTAMLQTSIAAVVLGCFHFCPLACDIPVMVVACAAVETGCMLEKYKWLHTCSSTTKGDMYVPATYTKFSFSFPV